MVADQPDDELSAARRRLIAKLDGDEYRPLVDWVLRPLSSVGRRSFRKEPYPSWLTSLSLVPAILLLGYVLGRLGGNTTVYGELFALSIGGAVAAAGMGLCTDLLTRLLQISLAEAVVPNMRALADFHVIEARLERIFDPRRQLAFSLFVGGLLFGVLLWIARGYALGPNLGLSTVTLAVCLSSASALYFSAPMMSFLPRLGRLDLELYQVNPRDSLVIVSLVGAAKQVLYIFAVLCALISIVAARHGLFNDPWLEIGLLTGLWVPVTVSFIGANLTFRAMIIRSKWRYLSRLQQQIEALLNDPAFPAGDLLERANKLMDHHDQVRKTPNSAIDYQSWLAYLNSMLLPFIAGLIANLPPLLVWLGLSEGS